MGEPNKDPFNCGGCHKGDFHQFDHFCDVLNVTDDEVPHAFAAWLGGTTSWDGEYGEVAEGSSEGPSGAEQ